MIPVALAARLRRDGLFGGRVAELAKELEGVCRARVFDRSLGDDFQLAIGVATHDGDLDDETFLHQEGKLAVSKRELASHRGGGELGQAGEVAALDGGEVLHHRVLVTEGHEAGRQAAAARFDGALHLAGARAVVRTDGGLARRQGLAERGGGVLAGLHRGGAALRTLFRGQGLALGSAGFLWWVAVVRFGILTSPVVREQVESMSARHQVETALEIGGKGMNPRELEVADGEESEGMGFFTF